MYKLITACTQQRIGWSWCTCLQAKQPRALVTTVMAAAIAVYLTTVGQRTSIISGSGDNGTIDIFTLGADGQEGGEGIAVISV